MSLFKEKPPDPGTIRDQLFNAIASNDAAEFNRLLQAHEQLVLKHALGWATLPETHRARDARDWYVQGLLTLAEQLARRGHVELWERVSAPTENDPFAEWQAGLQRVDQYRAEGRFREGVTEARRLLQRADSVGGPGANQLLAFTVGRLGECLFHLGEMEEARAHFTEALQLCAARGDSAGVAAYLGSLAELECYLGRTAVAAENFERSAGVLERAGQTAAAHARYRTAKIMRAGEPLCRIVVEIEGQEYELDEVPVSGITANFKLNFRRNRRQLGAAMVLNHAGVVEAQAERHTEALRCFQEAARIDRYDPWPHFHAGSVLCFEGRYADAIAAFDRVEALAPGFFHVRTDRWIAQQLATGRLTQQTFRIARYLLDNEPEPEDAASSALEALRTAPIAPLYLLAGDALRKLGKTRDAEKQYRLGLEVSEEPDVRTRLLLALSVVSENRDEGRELLRNAMELRGNLTAAAMAELALRSGQLDA